MGKFEIKKLKTKHSKLLPTFVHKKLMRLNELILNILNIDLPGRSAHKEMSFTNRNFEAPSNAIPSAVSILLFERNNTIYFPLIKRTENSHHHKGQIALPGGRKELNESLEQCAIRETCEELGLTSDSIKIIRSLSSLYIPISNHLVYPYLCYISENPEFSFNNNEVEKIIFCKVNDLIHFKKQIVKVKITDNAIIEAPSFIYKEEVIWGATALILNEWRKILLKLSIV